MRPGTQTPEALSALAQGWGCRFLHVVLDSGSHPSQPMLSWRQAEGVDAALERTRTLAHECERRGMSVLRVKVEVDQAYPHGLVPRYLEAHFKLELEAGHTRALECLAAELGIHLSRNASWRQAGKERRFLTARERDATAARALFDRVEAALVGADWPLVEVQREAVLFDSNLALDEGWAA